MASTAAVLRSPQTSAALLRQPAANKGRRKYQSPASIPHTESVSQISSLPPPFARSNFPTWLAVARATRSASPSAAIWLTSPICCAFITLKLRPVSSKIAHYRIAQIPLQPRNPAESRNQPQPQFRKAKSRHAVRNNNVANQRQLESAAKRDAVHRRDRRQRRRVERVHHGSECAPETPALRAGPRPFPSLARAETTRANPRPPKTRPSASNE